MRKKLIEVALPLEAINVASAKEKSIRHGHPSTLHLWWARRPLAACRAVLFASLVDDPSSDPAFANKSESEQEAERQRLFRIIEELVKWENSTNERVLEEARAEIRRSCGDKLPPILDPFCGGGSIPLEAQRLGLEAHASDLNPVAVLINKALIEIPPKFADRPPINPDWQTKPAAQKKLTTWTGARGLADDVRWYGRWMRDRAVERIGHLYPKVTVTAEAAAGREDLQPLVGQELTVIAWLWARTVECPNPACKARMPMVRSFWLSTKKERKCYAHPVIDREAKTVWFDIRSAGEPIKETSNRSMARCLFCEKEMKKAELRQQALGHGVREIPLVVVCELPAGRVYLPSNCVVVANIKRPSAPEIEVNMTDDKRWFSPPLYGLPQFADLFTARQLLALTTFSDLVGEVRALAEQHAEQAGRAADGVRLCDGGTGTSAYADAMAVYLAFAVDRMADRHSTITRWDPNPSGYAPKIASTFARQAIPMVWDYTEGNPFSDSSGNLTDAVEWVYKVIANIRPGVSGLAKQINAVESVNGIRHPCISSDPPYYDNIGYADLSDYFYVWLRRSLSTIYPDLMKVIVTPKREELIAAPHRHGGSKHEAERFFEENLGLVFRNMRKTHHPAFPLTVFYAFKQSEYEEAEAGTDEHAEASTPVHASTGWETMLEGLIRAEFQITGTWPMRTELKNRMIGIGTNALASSIVLVCRPRSADAKPAPRREFLAALKRELPTALRDLQRGNIAPVDLAQAAIGPGMAVFSRYKQVLESGGGPMTVRTALQIINQVLDEVLAEQDSDFDSHTRFALAWFEQYALSEGPFGSADVLARAKDCSLTGLVEAGVLHSRAGKVRLLKHTELPADWKPTRTPYVWEAAQHLIRALEAGGEEAAAEVLRLVGPVGETARELAYRLYNTCERKKWAEEARAYNSLVIAWPHIQQQAAKSQPSSTPRQRGLYDAVEE